MGLVELAPGVHRVSVAPADLLNVFVLVDDDGAVTLVDTGLRNAPRQVFAALKELGRAPQDVRTIVLSHAHPDHAGGLKRLAAGTGAQVASHERDAAHLRAGRVPARDPSTRSGRLLNRLPTGGFGATDVDQEFADGELLKVAGGLRVIHTPGHSPGHVSLLHEPTGVLLTGDALFNVRGLRYSPKSFCTDVRLSRETAHRLADLDFEVAAFTHGAEIRTGAREAVRAFLRGRPR